MATALDLTPAPGAAPAARRVLRHALTEAGLLVRNGEQLLLALVIPVGVLVLGPLLGDRLGGLDVLVPSVLALAVWSSAFTSVAIATGFERRYGVLERLAATPLGRSGLLAGKAGAVVLVLVGQLVVLVTVGLALGWRPRLQAASTLVAVALVVLAAAAFVSLALLLAGRLRAEITLAVANLIYVVLLVGGRSWCRWTATPPPSSRCWPCCPRPPSVRDSGPPRPARCCRPRHRPARLAARGSGLDPKVVPMDLTRLVRGPRALPRWAIATLVANIGIVVTGGLVRLTGSGLGCPTWPRCTDDSFVAHPELGIYGAIEFGNRLLTFVLIVIAVLTFASAALYRDPTRSDRGGRRRDLFWLSGGLALGIPAQGVVGGITVLTDLNPYLVAVHLLLSLVLISLAVWLVRLTRGLTARSVAPPWPLCRGSPWPCSG